LHGVFLFKKITIDICTKIKIEGCLGEAGRFLPPKQQFLEMYGFVNMDFDTEVVILPPKCDKWRE